MTVIEGDCFNVMKEMESNSIDFIVTDPPYGLSFMNKNWDKVLPNINIWKETLRICKPGAFMACFGGTRTFHRLTCLIEDSGWEIRDCIMWLQGQGFPKSKGCLKPAWEPIILARKRGPNPRLNIDDSRIKTDESLISPTGKYQTTFFLNEYEGQEKNGRWPANLILDEESAEMLDEQTGITKSSSNKRNNKPSENKCMSGSNTGHISYGHNDSGGASRFFYCAKASSRERNEGLEGIPLKNSIYSKNAKNGEGIRISNSKIPHQNNHPTVKPISLMRYIIKLLSPPNDPLLLDPFCGSGSTLIAAKELGIRSIGIEMNPEYCEIANKRLGKNLNSSQIFSLDTP